MSTSISITVYSKCEPENSVSTPISFKKLRSQNPMIILMAKQRSIFSATNNETVFGFDLTDATRWWQQLFLPIIHPEFFLGKILCFFFLKVFYVKLVFMESNLGFLSNLKFALKFIEIQLYTKFENWVWPRPKSSSRSKIWKLPVVWFFWFIWYIVEWRRIKLKSLELR